MSKRERRYKAIIVEPHDIVALLRQHPPAQNETYARPFIPLVELPDDVEVINAAYAPEYAGYFIALYHPDWNITPPGVSIPIIHGMTIRYTHAEDTV